MINFQDPEYRCFTFDIVDMTPTLEEYDFLLSCLKSNKVYFYTPIEYAPSNYVWIIKMSKKQAKAQAINKEIAKGGIGVFQKLKKKLYDKENKDQLKILALGIYGLVLFLSAKEVIDFKAINMFKSIIALQIVPV